VRSPHAPDAAPAHAAEAINRAAAASNRSSASSSFLARVAAAATPPAPPNGAKPMPVAVSNVAADAS
jgi:hypothetical protein